MKQLCTFALFFPLLLAIHGPLKAQEVGLPIGTVAEPVIVETLDGEEVNLDAYLGHQPVLMQFWATWCELCKALEPRMAAAHELYGDQVKFFAVAVGVNQSPRSIRRHLERNPTPYDFLWDARGRAVRAYMAPTTSYLVLFDASGAVTYTGVGADQEFEPSLAKVVEERRRAGR
jgi:thiol-disulfide isomerase/thioredoxin